MPMPGFTPVALQQLELSPSEFPTLGASNSCSSPRGSSGSSGKQSSPEHYTPSLAPYKQGFLASRGSAGWTSKLADVPAAAAADGEVRDAEAHVHAHTVRSAAKNGSCGTGGQRSSGGSRIKEAGAAVGTAAVKMVTGVPAGGSTGVAAGSAAGHQFSLADTLKQAAASSSAHTTAGQPSDVHRRHSKTLTLVPLLPGCKAKHGSSTTRTAAASTGLPLADTTGLKPIQPGTRAWPSAAAVTAAADLQLPSSSHTLLLTLSHSSGAVAPSSHEAAGVASSSGPAGKSGSAAGTESSSPTLVHSPVAAPASSSAGAGGPTGQSSSVSQQCKLVGGVGSASASEQRQQLRDRNSFFAVLRRKTSSSSGEQGGGSGAAGSASSSDGTAAKVADSAAAHSHQQVDARPVGLGDDAGSATAAEGAAAAVPPAAEASGDGSATSAVGLEEQPCSFAGDPALPSQQVAAAAGASGSDASVVAAASANAVDTSHPVSASSCKDVAHCELQCQVHVSECDASDDAGHHSASMLWDVPEDEEAFLRSLGWTAESSDDEAEWGLTEEEIAAFQASAAARAAAQQQQHAHQPQQLLWPAGVYSTHRINATSLLLQQKAGQLLPGAFCFNASQGRVGSNVGGLKRGGLGVGCGRGCVQGSSGRHIGLLLGPHLAPAAELLGFGSCDGSSSSSDDDDDR